MEGQITYSFQPGPSQLLPAVEYWTQVALKEGLLSRYHRDAVWKGIFRKAQEALSRYLDLPEGWLVTFVSSATEAWQILADAAADMYSLHIVQGEFGKRWYSLQKAVSSEAKILEVAFESPLREQLIAADIQHRAIQYLAVVHVETSVGAWIPTLGMLREIFPKAIIAVDATSSMGGIQIPWRAVDMAFASVQKCFGLPPGLGILVLSPQAVSTFRDHPRVRYNSLGYLIRQAERHEPIHTPNLLGIFLAAQVYSASSESVREVENRLLARSAFLYEAFERKGFQAFLPPAYRSPTVLTFRWRFREEAQVLRVKAHAEGLYVGWGYGLYKEETFRVANFPALPDEAYERL
ncbi:MAG: aminotransferase class V-fold PLP-dependent enzyme, partial [Bacteroidia bacterium]|nr:aminotransferase class V-fold PLP-dependent enzyme [Bacteroidia bacterium]MDW8058311.1 aminotransferase class V-fold PLP-dependent enzyme [Bacteroidia bacterium]